MVDARYGRVYYDDAISARMAMEAERLGVAVRWGD
jgi:hypothetical protein